MTLCIQLHTKISNVLKIKKRLFVYLLISYILIILFWGLWPFNFQSVNGVDWLKQENGIHFRNRGIVYGPAKNLDQIPKLGKNESISIELWLIPDSDDRKRSYIFCMYDESHPEIFSISQAKSLLNISKYKIPDTNCLNHDWRWLNKTFVKGQRRFLTITSDRDSTTIYLDGKKAKTFQDYSLTLNREQNPEYQVVIGNDPSGLKPWTGELLGLAIYNQALSPEQASEHFEKWKSESALSLLKEKDIIALYPMDEQGGKTIHNVVSDRYNLLIPDKFKILKKNFLQLSCNALKLDSSTLRDVAINILGFIPLGYFLFVYIFSIQTLKTPSWRLIILAILGGIALSFIIEILQAYLPTRNSSLSDLIFNTFGTGLGIILAFIFITLKTRSQRTSFSESQ